MSRQFEFGRWCRMLFGHKIPEGARGLVHCERCGVPIYIVGSFPDSVFKTSLLWRRL
jgi:hypothetical protein